MWKLLLITSPYLHGLSHVSFSPHISIQYDTDLSEREHYFLYSTHLETLQYEVEDDRNEAHYKSDVLLMLFNTALNLEGYPYPIQSDELVYSSSNGTQQAVHLRRIYPMIHIEQLNNPFTETAKLISTTSSKRFGYVIDLAYTDELFREVIILYGLLLKDYLYLLVNMYKISENIEYDMKSSREILNERGILLEPLEEALKPFQNRGILRHFANTRSGSGLQSRHGANDNRFDKTKPTYDEVLDKLKKMINEWIDIKIQLI